MHTCTAKRDPIIGPDTGFRYDFASQRPRVIESAASDERAQGENGLPAAGRKDEPERICSDPAESAHEGCSPNIRAFTQPPTPRSGKQPVGPAQSVRCPHHRRELHHESGDTGRIWRRADPPSGTVQSGRSETDAGLGSRRRGLVASHRLRRFSPLAPCRAEQKFVSQHMGRHGPSRRRRALLGIHLHTLRRSTNPAATVETHPRVSTFQNPHTGSFPDRSGPWAEPRTPAKRLLET